MKNKLSAVFIFTGTVLIVFALALTSYNILLEKKSEKEAEAVLVRINGQKEEKKDNIKKEPTYYSAPDMEMPVYTVDGKKYIGTVDIPAIDISLPVFDEWNYKNYKTAPCRYSGTAYKNGFVLSAHNYAAHFGKIHLLENGDEVIFTDAEENVFRYRVIDVSILGPYDIQEMLNDEYALTLFTCTIGGKNRVTVRCERCT